MADLTPTSLTDAEREDFLRNLRQNLGYRAFVIEDTMLGHVERIVAAARADERERITAVRDRMTRHRDDMRQESARTQRKEAKVLLGREAQSFDVAVEWLTAALAQPAERPGGDDV